MKSIISLMTMALAMNIYAANLETLFDLAKGGLKQNIVEIDDKRFTRAGANHFGSLWTRDFAYSIEGLLAINEEKAVKEHIETLLKNRHPKTGLIPRVLDNMNSANRVVFNLLPILGKPKPIKSPLKAEYVGEHKTVAIDSNILVLRGAILYLNKTGDFTWWKQNQKAFKELLNYYQNHLENGFITQEDYGDWQDSVKRKGVTFLTNFHYWWVINQIEKQGLLENLPRQATSFKRDLKAAFYDPNSNLYKSHAGLSVISLDGNLFALSSKDFFDTKKERVKLYQSLKNSPLWTRHEIPGFASYPDYPKKWASLNVRIVGLKHYHDRIFWSWLIGFSAKAAFLNNDPQEAKRILTLFTKTVVKEGAVSEIYRPRKKKKPLREFKSLLYRSEKPFSWGSAFVLDALNTMGI